MRNGDVGALAIACSDESTADTEPAVFPPEVESQLQQVLHDDHDQQGFPGATLSVQQGDTKRWAGAIGNSDLGADALMAPDDILRIGSITKIFVATLVLLLEEEGLLSVEGSVADYLPELLPNGDEIALYRLLNHTSGLHQFDNFGLGLTPQEIVEYAIDQGASFAPGQGWEYCNTGYLVAGMVVEVVTGTPWGVALRQRILDQHSLSRTYVGEEEPTDGSLARGYRLENESFLDVTADRELAVYDAAAGMASTAADVTRFFTRLQEGAIVSPASLERMREHYNVSIPESFTPVYANLPPTASATHGLGFGVIVDGGRTTYTHSGMAFGYQSHVAFEREPGICAAALLNVDTTMPGLAASLVSQASSVVP